MAQTSEQLNGKRVVANAQKATLDASTSLMKWMQGKANDKPAGGYMFRVCSGVNHLGNYWGQSPFELRKHLNKSLSFDQIKKGFSISPLV